jgi:hypothetical protein
MLKIKQQMLHVNVEKERQANAALVQSAVGKVRAAVCAWPAHAPACLPAAPLACPPGHAEAGAKL